MTRSAHGLPFTHNLSKNAGLGEEDLAVSLFVGSPDTSFLEHRRHTLATHVHTQTQNN